MGSYIVTTAKGATLAFVRDVVRVVGDQLTASHSRRRIGKAAHTIAEGSDLVVRALQDRA